MTISIRPTDEEEARLSNLAHRTGRSKSFYVKAAPRTRAEVLRRAFEIMSPELEDCARLIVLENGKSCSEARGEAAYAAEFFRWFSEEACRVPGDFRLSPSGDKTIVVDHRPLWRRR